MWARMGVISQLLPKQRFGPNGSKTLAGQTTIRISSINYFPETLIWTKVFAICWLNSVVSSGDTLICTNVEATEQNEVNLNQLHPQTDTLRKTKQKRVKTKEKRCQRAFQRALCRKWPAGMF